ncbi:MAG: chemotaxis protein CheA [Micavibrio aeruginosavorus]|uniref:histidine kinase n=1 Tax=Micavibrio aeruginosavorus TaxID=349221 RepID=A0A7T5UHM6_9BACT|nr:MAG: chemotaxis protein CheA [Micavibrio aeruginosavorus]
MDDIIAEFLAETNESLAELDNYIVLLEQNPDDINLVTKIFRVMHTIKGTCGFLGLPRLERVAHKSEDILGLVRDGRLHVQPVHVTLILEALDTIKTIIGGLERQGSEPAGSDADLINRLEAAYAAVEGGAGAVPPPIAPATPENEAVAPVAAAASKAEFPAAQDHPVAEAVAPAGENAPAAPAESGVASQTLRVQVEVLEDLMTMVSELVLTRNQLLQILRQQNQTEFSAPLQRLNLVVSELQEGVMKTRMQPIGNAWSKLPRIIRDISQELGKKIDLEMHGQETELDRQVLEMIKDPLTHMIRNSADHGLETPEERVAAGKPAAGKIRLNACHEGGHIIIQIADDGRGLPLEKIKAKIIQNGLASEADVAAMSPQTIYQYIFKAGFSTADKVTAVSGRGVGMDVVRTNIENIGGSIELRSQEGQGTFFTIKIPLTLAIVSALIVGVQGERFAIPQLSVSELVMVNGHGGPVVEMINNAPVFRLRDRLLPLVDMAQMLGLKPGAASADDCRYIVVSKIGSYDFGMIVDRVFDTEEIVVKPVSALLKNLHVFSGNTILGDGQVIMILDPAGILRVIGMEDAAEQIGSTVGKEADTLAGQVKETSLLLFMAGNQNLRAVPLDGISRLEDADYSDVEYADGQMVIQYRDALMPLYTCEGIDVSAHKSGQAHIIVFPQNGKPAGLLVDKILDICNYRGDIDMGGSGPVLGSVIINAQATDIINIDWFERGRQGARSGYATAQPPGKNGGHTYSNGNGQSLPRKHGERYPYAGHEGDADLQHSVNH